MHNHGSHSLAKTLESEPLTELVMLNRTKTKNQNLCHHVLNPITCILIVEVNPGQSGLAPNRRKGLNRPEAYIGLRLPTSHVFMLM